MVKIKENDLLENSTIDDEILEVLKHKKLMSNHQEMLMSILNENYTGMLSDNAFRDLSHLLKMYEYKNDFGYVYFLKSNYTGLTKIGYTLNLKKRLSDFKRDFVNMIGIDPEFELIALFMSHKKVIGRLEKEMHSMYKEKRIRGEWFNLELGDVCEAMDLSESTMFEEVDDVFVAINDYYDWHLFEDIDRNQTLYNANINVFEESHYNENGKFKGDYVDNTYFRLIKFTKEDNVKFQVTDYWCGDLGEKRVYTYPNDDTRELININTLKRKVFNEKEIRDTLSILKS